jgi:hypothetical protein
MVVFITLKGAYKTMSFERRGKMNTLGGDTIMAHKG